MEKKEFKILILDVETTSVSPKSGCLLEIGAAELDLVSGKITKVFDSLLLEESFNESHWEYLIARENGIKDIPYQAKGWIFGNSDLITQMIFEAPIAKGVLKQFQEVLNNYPNGVTAYNNPFDFGFLESRGLNISVKLDDPMRLLTPYMKLPQRGRSTFKWPKVQEAWDYFFGKTDYVEQHRGADDAIHEAKIVFEMIKRGWLKVPGFEIDEK